MSVGTSSVTAEAVAGAALTAPEAAVIHTTPADVAPADLSLADTTDAATVAPTLLSTEDIVGAVTAQMIAAVHPLRAAMAATQEAPTMVAAPLPFLLRKEVVDLALAVFRPIDNPTTLEALLDVSEDQGTARQETIRLLSVLGLQAPATAPMLTAR